MTALPPFSFRERRFGRRRRRREPRQQTAFVLSGGASLGAIQVGMVQALYERGITPDLLVGTSVGGLNAAFLASRPPTVETAEQLADVWVDVRRDQLFPLSIPGLVNGLRGRRDYLVSSDALRTLAEEHLELDRLEDADVSLHLTAYDVLTGEDVRLSSGSALDAVVAAAAIPGVYPPVEVGERLLVDGGVYNNTPLAHAVDLGATRIFVLATTSLTSGPAARPRGALDAAVNAVALLVNRGLQDDVDRFADRAEITVLPAINAERVQPTDFTRAAELIDEARAAAQEVLDAEAAQGEPAARRA